MGPPSAAGAGGPKTGLETAHVKETKIGIPGYKKQSEAQNVNITITIAYKPRNNGNNTEKIKAQDQTAIERRTVRNCVTPVQKQYHLHHRV